MERFICIHGHFYQPPRENPWLEAIEIQDEAYPYHDWNRRITAECYATNATSRILDDENKILRIVNNYSKISFNFGPTLLSWLEDHSPEVYREILQADKISREVFSGHGSAMAQAYNHMIMPLAKRRDKETQIVWGIRDFEHRFGRLPEGMWLPETAVDLETLDIMAAAGIHFTILAPHQAARVRDTGDGPWSDVSGGTIDPRFPYELHLPSGASMALFFYDGNISKAVAFEKLLSSGVDFARRLIGGFTESSNSAQLVHIATDGESYGHHHRFGDMALAYALHYIETNDLAKITNYGEFLEKYPPVKEVEILEDTSWSCAHGVERWRSDCGCQTGAAPGWNQAWRGPLREALDELNDELFSVFKDRAKSCLKDARAARNGYIDVILDRTEAGRKSFLEKHALNPGNGDTGSSIFKLMELQRQAMLMLTSCGWFFDDISGVETVQILQYAARAMELARDITGRDYESGFTSRLAPASSNKKPHWTGRDIYTRLAKHGMVDFSSVAAHYAMCSLFEDEIFNGQFYCYHTVEAKQEIRVAGKATLALGHARFISEITLDERTLCYGSLHLGDHNISGGVTGFRGLEHYARLVEDVTEPFERGDFHETLRRFDHHFDKGTYGLKSLFRDEQRRILDQILRATMKDVEAVYRRIYEDQVPLMRFLMDAEAPTPKELLMAAGFVLQNELKRRFEVDDPDPYGIQDLLEEAESVGVTLDTTPLEFSFRRSVERIALRLRGVPEDLLSVRQLADILSLLDFLPFTVNLRTVQNVCYELKEFVLPMMRQQAAQGEEGADEWMEAFFEMSDKLKIRIQ